MFKIQIMRIKELLLYIVICISVFALLQILDKITDIEKLKLIGEVLQNIFYSIAIVGMIMLTRTVFKT